MVVIVSNDVIWVIEFGVYGWIVLMMFEWVNDVYICEIVFWIIVVDCKDVEVFVG